MSSIRKNRIYIFLLILFATGTVYAQGISELMDMSLEELMNIDVITASKKKEKLIETPAGINVITDEDIEMLNLSSIEEVLEYVVGISSVNGEGNIFTTTTIRGNTLVNYNTNTLLLLDGMPYYQPYSGSFNFVSVSIASIKRIEIVKGSNSVLYGTNAINAVINIITKTIDDDKTYEAQAKMKLGSNRSMHTESFFFGRSGKSSYSIFGDTYVTQGEELALMDEKGNTLNLAQNLKSVAYGAKYSYDNKFNVNFNFYNRHLPNYRTKEFTNIYVINSESDSTVEFIPTISDEYGISLNTNYRHTISENAYVNLRASYFDWWLHRENYNGYWDYESQIFSTDLELSFNPFQGNSNIAGLSYSNANARRYKSEIDSYDIGKENERTNDVSLYFNGSQRIIDILTLYYGGRYYSSNYKEKSFVNISPRFGLVYKAMDNLYLKALYGESFRVPTYFEKEVSSETVLGNPDLDPEQSRSIDFIISNIYKGIQSDIDIFMSEINNKITRIEDPDGSGKSKNMNIETVLFTGVEFNSKYRFQNGIKGFFGYSYVNGKDKESGEELKFTYNNMINFGISNAINNFMEIKASGKYLDKWGDTKSYILMNLGVKLTPFSDNRSTFTLQVDNITNEKIYLPEIARFTDLVPTIPKTMERRYTLAFSIKF